ncbi:50S ribosomal protein L19 [Rhabdochlamydiaceae symbiont of Dictyostelium giganteum]|uniref:50S ribosomal protein L19 n=1 Tax=Rhabdochlamydiaceae symbiont of Dictyostelium giganteum TaxID=3342349 RepID=UPI00384B47F1
MKQNKIIQDIEGEFLKSTIPSFRVGDTICIHTRIIEGEKERIQMFAGTVIARRGSGLSETVALYRVSYNTGMERVFLLHSPRIAKIEVTKSGDVRKSKLYHLRGAFGKAAKVKEKIGVSAKKQETKVEENA